MRPMKFRQLDLANLDAAVAHPDVVMQQKIDGIRAMLVVVARSGELSTRIVGGGGEGLKSATAAPVAERVIAWAERTFTAGRDYEMRIDGEIIGEQWWMFDMPRSPRTTEMTPLERRVRLLGKVIDRLTADTTPMFVRLLPTAWTADQKRILVDRVRSEGGEGVMVKHRRSTYQWDTRATHSLKAKFTHTVDAIVLERNVGGPDKCNAVLGLMDGCEVDEIGNCSMIGKPDAQPGDVVEVKYLYAGAGGRLVQPTLLRIRRDKKAAECTPDQLSFVNKAVLHF